MRIVYITDALRVSGVARKSVAQASEWQRQGHEVWLATARHPQLMPLAAARAQLDHEVGARSFLERVRGEVDYRLLFATKLSAAARAHAIDVVYTREVPMAVELPALLRRVPTVLEVNGDALAELPRLGQRLVRRHVRGYELSHAAGVVFVSHELQRRCRPGTPRRATVIANPCPALDDAELPTPMRPARPTLVMIGTLVHGWNGFDKMITMAELLPQLDFVVVGAQLSGPPNLRSLPHLSQAEVNRVLRGCTVGVGSLAMHRTALEEASPLKSRNYLAVGLPIIQAYRDTDLTEADGCVLALPNCEDNIRPQLARIADFAQRAYADPTLGERARALARGRLSMAEKERARLAFMRECSSAAR
ncbi:MAG TPA: glycosyltransferase [Polyangiales bacterium]